MFVDHLVDIVNCTHHLHTDSRGKGIRLSLVIMNCWGPKEFVHSKGNLFVAKCIVFYRARLRGCVCSSSY